ncbi:MULTISPECIES: helix-turn-helix domain-containing protein [Streptomyces]|uniref:helix-turn-helix domain-containing protein n=1 Tax=Streptomyces TaxID=1883 RepID=UPI00159000EC|nr:helix-turn-helix domain-containing protein [Streptomyces harbinensis]QKV67329.1 helix-turn-helix domain-containing protein [Streptomyces harbinensis]
MACEGAGCRRGAGALAPDLAAPGSRLCPTCRLALHHDLRRLPALYEQCGELLTGTSRPLDRTSGGPLPGMPFNTAAADARSAIVGTLRGWAALTIDEGPTDRIPEDTPARLTVFLLRHADWLAAHPAAGELSAEAARCVRRARRVIDPGRRGGTRIGDCVMSGCSGTVVTLAESGAPGGALQVGCTADPAHRWSGREWLRRGRPDGARQPAAVSWLTARDIALLWGIAPGSVYRRASEDRWRRSTRGGRTYYHRLDVEASLEGRR